MKPQVFLLAVPYLAVLVISHVSYYKCFEIKLSHIPSQILQGNNTISRLRPCQCFYFFWLIGMFLSYCSGLKPNSYCLNYVLVLFAGLNKNLLAGGKKCDLLFLPLHLLLLLFYDNAVIHGSIHNIKHSWTSESVILLKMISISVAI